MERSLSMLAGHVMLKFIAYFNDVYGIYLHLLEFADIVHVYHTYI